jgi:hypothetical protein
MGIVGSLADSESTELYTTHRGLERRAAAHGQQTKDHWMQQNSQEFSPAKAAHWLNSCEFSYKYNGRRGSATIL